MDFIEDFVSTTDVGLSPERYRRWVGLCLVAAALDRKVWTALRRGIPLFPNLFVLLVGPPATGKTQAILPARALLDRFPAIELCPDSITHEDFIRKLGERATLSALEGTSRATMAVFLSEWGTFLRKPDNDTLSMLAAVYDSDRYSASTISRGLDNATNLYVNILAGTTPAWFAEGFPANAYEQGLPTRMHFIWSESHETPPEFDFRETTENVLNVELGALVPAFKRIVAAKGFCAWEPDAAKAFNAWRASGFEPVPLDPLLRGYTARRPLHAAKISVIVAVARHPERLAVALADWNRAKEIVLEAEPDMSVALAAAGGNIYQMQQRAAASFVEAEYLKHRKGVPEHRVRRALGRLVPPQALNTILNEMIAQRQMHATGETPNRILMPGAH